MRHGSLFSGIGGFDLAAEWMGWENVFHCEWNEFGQKILKHYWPNAKSYGDITTTDFNVHRGQIDIITGGFPCQPYSVAGKRKGKEDDRHLWPEMLRAIREVQPRWVVGENVPGLLNWEGGLVLDEIKADLETAGFEIFPPLVLPACGLNAPHRRDRLWIIAYSGLQRPPEPKQPAMGVEQLCKGWTPTNANSDKRCERGLHKAEPKTTEGHISSFNALGNERNIWQNFPTQPPLCGRDDGIPNRVDRIKALGNAIVPQVAYEIFKAIQQCQTF